MGCKRKMILLFLCLSPLAQHHPQTRHHPLLRLCPSSPNLNLLQFIRYRCCPKEAWNLQLKCKPQILHSCLCSPHQGVPALDQSRLVDECSSWTTSAGHHQ